MTYQLVNVAGHDWLGEVPQEWQIKKFKYLFTLSNEKYKDNPIGEMLSVSGYRGIELKEYDHELQKRTPEELQEYRIVRLGQLVVNTMWLNYAGLGISELTGYVSPAYRSYFVSDEFHPRYVHHLMRSEIYVRGYTKYMQGIRPNSLQIKTDDFNSFPILVPPYETQKQIAAFLDRETEKIDALIAKQERLIGLLAEKRQAVISHAVTKGLNTAVEMKDSGIEWLGQIPAHWEVIRLKHLCSHIVDCLHSTPAYKHDGVFPAIRTSDVNPGFLDVNGAKKVDKETFDERNVRLVPKPDDIIYSREGGRFGIAAPIPENASVCLGQRVMLFRIRDSNRADYVMWHLNADSVYRQAEQDSLGAASPHVNVETINNFFLAIPPLDEQRKIVDEIWSMIERYDDLLSKSQQQIELLQERRTALISAAVTGKIDLTGFQNLSGLV